MRPIQLLCPQCFLFRQAISSPKTKSDMCKSFSNKFPTVYANINFYIRRNATMRPGKIIILCDTRRTDCYDFISHECKRQPRILIDDITEIDAGDNRQQHQHEVYRMCLLVYRLGFYL